MKRKKIKHLLIDGTFNNIYNFVISYASTNINELKFSIFCCSDNIHSRCIPLYPIPEYYNINITTIIPSILIKIKDIFPDIEITTEPFNNIDNTNNNNNGVFCDDNIKNIYTLFW